MSRIRQGCLLSPLILYYARSNVIKQEEERECIQIYIKEEINLSLYADAMLVYVENLKDSRRKKKKTKKPHKTK